MKTEVEKCARWHSRMAVRIAPAALCVVLSGISSGVWAQAANAKGCTPPRDTNTPPRDFRQTTAQSRAHVERRHFTPKVETLVGGESTSSIAADVGYTLRKFPNHHRALLTMMRLGERYKSDTPPGSEQSISCWFEHALAFTPSDTVVRGLYATYLHSTAQTGEAIRQLDIAQRYAGDDPVSVYSIGAVYFDIGQHQLALEQALKARRLGDPRTGLEQALRKAGRWVDPPN